MSERIERLLWRPVENDNAAMEAEVITAPPKRNRRWFQFSLRTLLIGVTLLACLLGLWTHWDYFPGTLRRERNGVFHGTGTIHGFYANGAIMVEQDYQNGLLLRERSYRPDGSLFVSSEFDIEHGGTASISSKTDSLR